MLNRIGRSRRPGVTLIMVAGVLAVLAALGAGFYTLMNSQVRSTLRYTDIVRAELMARGGIEDAIARLREQAYFKTEDPTDPWYTVNYQNAAARRVSYPSLDPKIPPGASQSRELSYTRSLGSSAGDYSDRYILNVVDCGGKININACDNLGYLLDNLCRVVGAPLTAADLNLLQPARWAAEGAGAEYNTNKYDNYTNLDIYHVLDETGSGKDPISGLPTRAADKSSLYGDGFSIAAYRSRHGLYKTIYDVKNALTVSANPAHPELETMEREIKFNALRDYITVDSWVDTNTVCVGKFEWVNSSGISKQYINPNYNGAVAANKTAKTGPCQIFIDRDKSWVADDPVNDPLNLRGSLRGCYVSIMNGHGSGQLRRIATNGSDWIAVEMASKMHVEPGPISSYMIIAREDAQIDTTTMPGNVGKVSFPRVNASGQTVHDPDIDYSVHSLCIHRAPVNINTASDKVLTAMFMGINVQHGHPMAIGTDVDLLQTVNAWQKKDMHNREEFVLTPKGLKRVPVTSGKLVINRPKAWAASDNAFYDYLGNFGALGAPNFKATNSAGSTLNEAHELAYRIILARQRSLDKSTGLPTAANKRDPDAMTFDAPSGFQGYERGPFRSWDDFYFRVVKPWDDVRSYQLGAAVPNSGKQNLKGQGKMPIARMIMAHFNSNTDILKFNPNIEFIDRWGRNYTEMEPVMAYTDTPDNGAGHTKAALANPVDDTSVPIFAIESNGGKILGVPGDPKPGAYVIRSFRYKPDEMIDKTDMNRSTTEFSFDSNGIYELTSLGQVVKNGEVLAERRIDSLVKVYEVWRESTQRQFVNGSISEAANQKLGWTNGADGHYSGTIARDGDPKHISGTTRLALTTQPEPLVPIKYSLAKSTGAPNQDILDTFRDAYGRPRSNPYGGGGGPDVPDIIANRVLPAGYDGQLVLASNMSSYDPSDSGDADTFLASFNGDLDTNTCRGNGREQAKTPNNVQVRVVDTIGLLGLLGDNELDNDVSITGTPYVPDTPPSKRFVRTYPFTAISVAMEGFDTRPIGAGRTPYWENAMCRMGDLRTDGVYLGSPGAGGNDATLKWCVGEASPDKVKAHLNLQFNDNHGTSVSMWAKPTWHHDDNRGHEFFSCVNPGKGSRSRCCYITKDGRVKWANLTGTTFGLSDAGSRNNDLGFGFEGHNAGGGDPTDPDYPVYLHGGYTGVPQSRLHQYDAGKPASPESAAYRVQPFRWHYIGCKIDYSKANQLNVAIGKKYSLPRPAGDGGSTNTNHQKEGYLSGNQDQYAKSDSIDTAYLAAYYLRPFIDTERYPEQPNFAPNSGLTKGDLPKSYPTLYRKYWCAWQIDGGVAWGKDLTAGDWYGNGDGWDGLAGKPSADSSFKVDGKPMDCHHGGDCGQPIAWAYANGSKPDLPRVFSINNLNLGDPANVWGPNVDAGNFYDIYHNVMEEGTYAVIDELKISNKTSMRNEPGSNDRVLREMTTSRYYLPHDPSSRSEGPTFTSQTLLQSLKGSTTTAIPEKVTLARVTWTVFTPRFMHEYKDANFSKFTRKNQNVTDDGAAAANFKVIEVPIKGPFDTDLYNNDNLSYGPGGEKTDNGRKNRFGSVERPFPYDYKGVTPNDQPHATRGVEVELLNDTVALKGAAESHRGWGDFKAVTTFVDPDVENRLGSPSAPAEVNTDKLRYRVRFAYPVDPLADPKSGGANATVNPSRQYLLDTPVFDDISVTYYSKPKILMYRLVNE